MAALPPPITQLGGNHGVLFSGYWSMLDPQNTGKIDASTAAAFLKKSQLREPVLHKIWNMSDPTAQGHLDKQGLFMALRLIAMCQAGKEPLVTNMALGDPPPKFAGVEPPPTLLANKWSLEDSEKAKYEQTFQGLQPTKGFLPGDKAKPFMLSSKLPLDTLGKIWTLSDIDKDGNLDLDEFCVAMKLISLAKGGEVLPAVLPSSLVPASKKRGSVSSPSVLPAMLVSTSTAASTKQDSSPSHSSPLPPRKGSATPINPGVVGSGVEWVVTPELKTKYDGYFQGIDKDHDGYVSGEEARSIFMASNLQQSVLAHVWNLCDIEKKGQLNAEQFALAMYLIAEKVRKKEVPKELTPAMVPPSLRGKVPVPLSTSAPPVSATTAAATAFSGWNQAETTSVVWATPTSTAAAGNEEEEEEGFGNDFSAIQELDSITNDIVSIKKEKVQLTEDIRAKQELIQQKRVELEGFQDDVDHASKQRETLEKEREQARTLLEQLNGEKARFEGQVAEIKQNCDDEREEIERLRTQLSAQETSNRSQAEELERLQLQFQELKKEEQEYQHKVEASKAEVEKLQKVHQNLNTDITQVRHRIENLKEEHQSLSTALTMYTPANTASGNSASSGVVNINDVGKLSAELHVPHLAEHDAISARATAGSSSPVSSLSGFSTNSHLEEGPEEGLAKDDKTHSDPFASSQDPFATFAAFSIPTAEDSFGGRGFSGKPSVLSAFDPFGGANDPFKSTATSLSSAPTTGEELFKSSDPFTGTNSSAQISSSSSASSLPPPLAGTGLPAVDPFSGQDPFKGDPFTSSNKEAAQPSSLSLWGGSSPFELDPFGQQSIQTPTDPFASSDPFGGDDPFGMKSGSSVASNPFGGGGGAEFPATWKQDKTEHKS